MAGSWQVTWELIRNPKVSYVACGRNMYSICKYTQQVRVDQTLPFGRWDWDLQDIYIYINTKCATKQNGRIRSLEFWLLNSDPYNGLL